MAFSIQHIAAARDALAVAADNLKRYPYLTARLNSQFIYLPEGEQDVVTSIMRARMNDDAAANVASIFDHCTCSQCGRVGRACQCKKAEAAAS
jgi:hypothetical protein